LNPNRGGYQKEIPQGYGGQKIGAALGGVFGQPGEFLLKKGLGWEKPPRVKGFGPPLGETFKRGPFTRTFSGIIGRKLEFSPRLKKGPLQLLRGNAPGTPVVCGDLHRAAPPKLK